MKNIKALTMIELAVSITIVAILATTALPSVAIATRRTKEMELRYTLRTLREAIDKYYDLMDKRDNHLSDDDKYPKSFEDMLEKRVLRRIPIDPITGNAQWDTLSTTDDRDDFIRMSTDGYNIYDIRSKSEDISLLGTPYYSW